MDAINKEFIDYPLMPSSTEDLQYISLQFDKLLNDLFRVINRFESNEREFAIAKTKLEESCFFAKKAFLIGENSWRVSREKKQQSDIDLAHERSEEYVGSCEQADIFAKAILKMKDDYLEKVSKIAKNMLNETKTQEK